MRFAKEHALFVQPGGCVIEVENQSGKTLDAVRLLELGKIGEIGPLAPGEKKRVSLDGRQGKKPVSLAFGRTRKSERHAGWRLNDPTHAGESFFKLETTSDDSVLVHHNRF